MNLHAGIGVYSSDFELCWNTSERFTNLSISDNACPSEKPVEGKCAAWRQMKFAVNRFKIMNSGTNNVTY